VIFQGLQEKVTGAPPAATLDENGNPHGNINGHSVAELQDQFSA